jgi:hypothetical protein
MLVSMTVKVLLLLLVLLLIMLLITLIMMVSTHQGTTAFTSRSESVTNEPAGLRGASAECGIYERANASNGPMS